MITIILIGILSILILDMVSIELLLANAVIGTVVPAIVAPFALNLLKQATNWEQVNQDLELENVERKRLEEEARQTARDMHAISQLAIECAAAPRDTNSVKLIAVSGQVLEAANQLVGHNLVGMVNNVTPEMEQRMLESQVEAFDDLSEVSFGAIPKPVATLIKNTLGVGKFTGMALSHGKSLIGTAIIVQGAGQPKLNLEVCKTLAHFSAVAIQRKTTESELHESETKFRTLIENLSDGILLVDEQGFIIEWNPSHEALIGLKREEVIGKPIWDVQFQFMEKRYQTPEYYERIKQQSREILTSGKFDNFNLLQVFRLKK